MSYFGDIRLGDTIDVKFVTTAAATGAPTTLAGSPVVSAYVGNGTTEITAGITLTVDFDSRTGLNNVRVVATTGNGFATATNVQLVITTGTVGGTSVVGYVIGTFSIENRSSYSPPASGLTGPYPQFGIAESGTAQGGTTSTIQLRAATSFVDDNPLGWTVWIYGGTGTGQSRLISDWVSGTDTATVSANWQTTPDATSTYIVYPTGLAPASGATLTAADIWTYTAGNGRQLTALDEDFTTIDLNATPVGAVASVTGNVGGNVVGTVGTVNAIAANAVNANALAADAVTEITNSVWANLSRTLTGATNITSTGGSIPIDGSGLVSINVVRINGALVQGAGTSLNLWRG